MKLKQSFDSVLFQPKQNAPAVTTRDIKANNTSAIAGNLNQM